MKKIFYVFMLVFGVLSVVSVAVCKLGFIDLEACLIYTFTSGLLMFISYALYCIAADKELESKHINHVKYEPVTLSDFDFELTDLRRDI